MLLFRLLAFFYRYFLQRTLNSHALWGILITWWFGRELQCDVLLSCDDVFENILYGRLVEDQYMKEERRSILLFHHALFSHSCVEGDIMCHHGSSSFCCLLLVFFYHSAKQKCHILKCCEKLFLELIFRLRKVDKFSNFTKYSKRNWTYRQNYTLKTCDTKIYLVLFNSSRTLQFILRIEGSSKDMEFTSSTTFEHKT